MTIHTTRSTTRRAILAGIAAVPAAAAASLPALASAGEISFPALAARYAAIYDRWFKQREADEAQSAAADKMYQALTGEDWEDRPKFNEPGYEQWRENYDAKIKPVIDKECPPNKCDEHGVIIVWEQIHNDLFPLCEEIMRQPAQTIADLGLQAQAYALMNDYEYGEDGDLCALIDNVCKLAGVEPLPGVDVSEPS